MITSYYVSIMFIYNTFNYYGLFGCNRRHSMLVFHNYNIILIWKGHQENIANNYVSIFDHLQQFSHFCLKLNYSRYQIPALPFTFGGMFYTQITRKELPTFILVSPPLLMLSYLHWLRNNIQHSMLDNPEKKSLVWPIIIANNYVRIMFIHHQFRNHGISVSNSKN